MKQSVERVAAREALTFVRKDSTKLRLVFGLYALSARDWEAGKVARASYFFTRHLDDLLDGERNGVADPAAYAEDLKAQVQSGKFKKSSPIARLAEYAIPVLERRGRPSDDPRGEFVRIIDSLMFDHYRRQERRVLTGDQLTTYYSELLDPCLNLMLIGIRSNLRTQDLPDYSPNIGRLYSVRDLPKDWELGFVNIPSEVLEVAGLDAFSPFGEVVGNSTIHDWLVADVVDASANLEAMRQQLGETDYFTRLTLGGLISQAVRVEIPSIT